MEIQRAIELARLLAANNGAKLGDCLFSEPLGGLWAFQFEIVDGPNDWSWAIVVGETEDVLIFAIRNRPSLEVHPRFRSWVTHEWRIIAGTG